MKLKHVVARTDFFPFSLVYESIYWLGIRYLVYRLKHISAVKGVYLTGSVARNDLFHGVSDIDFFIVLDWRFKDDNVVMSNIRLALTDAIDIFPFLGPYRERKGCVVVMDDQGNTDHANFRYRSTTQAFRPVYEAAGFKYVVPNTPPNPIDVLSEINILIRNIFLRIVEHTDNVYSWKAKIRPLIIVLTGKFMPTNDPELASLTDDERDLLFWIWKQKNPDIYYNTDIVTLTRAYNLTFTLIDLVLKKIGLQNLPEKWVDYNRVEEQGITVSYGNVVNGLLQFEEPKPLDWSFCGLGLLDNLPTKLRIVDCRGLLYPQLITSVREAYTDHDVATIFFFPGFAARVQAGDILVGNEFGAPFSNRESINETQVCFKEPFLQSLIAQADNTREELTLQALCLSAPPERERVPDVPESAYSSARYLLYLEDDRQVISSFLDCYKLNGIKENPIRLYCSIFDIFQDLRRRYPDAKEFIDHLEAYYQQLSVNKTRASSNSLPSNFYGFMIEFFSRAIITGEPMLPIGELHKKLSLSLCVCTRDRAEYLKQLLQSIAAQSRLPEELVIVDNSTNNDTRDVIRSFENKLPIKYVEDKQSNLPALRNRAIREASSEIICFTDDDCVLDPDWLAHVERTFLRGERIGAVGGVVRHLNDSAQDNMAAIFNNEYLGQGALRC